MFSAIAFVLAIASPAPVPAPQSLVGTKLQAPRAMLHVQIARTEAERERGLMGVKRLAPHTGMVFVFDRDAPVAFWMKDTLIPLDMVFISGAGTVRTVYDDVPVVSRSLPDDKIPLEQGSAKYVIELAAGEAAHDGLQPGAHVAGLPK
jgi:uncharacterized protein